MACIPRKSTTISQMKLHSVCFISFPMNKISTRQSRDLFAHVFASIFYSLPERAYCAKSHSINSTPLLATTLGLPFRLLWYGKCADTKCDTGNSIRTFRRHQGPRRSKAQEQVAAKRGLRFQTARS